MEKLNIQPFYLGQKVVHVGDPFGFLGKNTTHTVTGVHKCSCGCFVLGIDHDLLSPITTGRENCFKCKTSVSGKSGAMSGYMSTDFRPLQEAKFKAVSFEKITQEVELICEN